MPDSARALSDLFHSVFLVELLKSKLSAYPTLTPHPKTGYGANVR